MAVSDPAVEAKLEKLRDQGWTIHHRHELGAECDERCVPRPPRPTSDWANTENA